MFRRTGKTGRGAGGTIDVGITPDTPPTEPENPPVNITVPTISGDLGVNGILTVTPGTYTGNPPTVTYQWQRSEVDIDGETSNSYQVTESDVGSTLRVAEIAANAFGEVTTYSAATATVAGVAPVNTVAPTRSGGSNPPVVGETIRVVPGTWTGVPVPTLTYQWRDDADDITGETGLSLLLTPARVGGQISCRETATNTAGSSNQTTTQTAAVVSNVPESLTISNLIVTSLSASTASISVDADIGRGTMWWVILPNAASAPSAAQIKAGTDGSGNAAVWADSLTIAGINTLDASGGPSGLSAVTYKAYAVQEDVDNTFSNILSYQFGSGGAVTPPTLTSFTASAGADDRWGNLSVTTDQPGGTIYWVVTYSFLPAPNAEQLIAGKDGTGLSAPFSGNTAVASAGAYAKTATGLTNATAYKAYVLHRISASNVSSVYTSSSFTTDTLIFSCATNGTTTGMTSTPVNGTFTTNVADPDGGTNAISLTATNTGAVTTCSMSTGTKTFYNGVNRIRAKMKALGAASPPMWSRVTTANLTSGHRCNFNLTAGTIGTETMTGTPTITALGNDWYQLDCSADMTGFADLSGILTFPMNSANEVSTITLNSTNRIALYDLRVTRVT